MHRRDEWTYNSNDRAPRGTPETPNEGWAMKFKIKIKMVVGWTRPTTHIIQQLHLISRGDPNFGMHHPSNPIGNPFTHHINEMGAKRFNWRGRFDGYVVYSLQNTIFKCIVTTKL
jgi:hypothetical protein